MPVRSRWKVSEISERTVCPSGADHERWEMEMKGMDRGSFDGEV
jgi:hypothetical protein